MTNATAFNVVETTIADVHAAYKAGSLTVQQLVQIYLDRIAAYDKAGPAINAIISLNPRVMEEADRLDAAMKSSGFVGAMHGIPIIIKDQADVDGMPTTIGSVLFEGHMPGRDCTVAARLKAAGAIILGKSTLGEMGAGDTHGSLFGSTRCVYDLHRTAGGSSGGSGAAVSANFCTVAIGQEGFASIRRPSIWNGVIGMRPTAGLVSRGGVYAGWPSIHGSLGPMCRTVTDAARLLDGMVGYDPLDPLTARGVGQSPQSYAALLDKGALEGARVGILREPMGYTTEPCSDDYARVTEVFDVAVGDLTKAGATVVDPIVIPDLRALLATRAASAEEEEASFAAYMKGSAKPPYASRADVKASPLFARTMHGVQDRWGRGKAGEALLAYYKARDLLMTRMLAVMADHKLDAIVHKAVEHTPTLIEHGVKPPYVDQKGAPHINTFLVFVPSVVVPAGFTRDHLPAGITFLGRPYDDARMLRLAYAYEQATKHRAAPSSTP